jgi:nucleoside-diphosphate-sugar epimerase
MQRGGVPRLSGQSSEDIKIVIIGGMGLIGSKLAPLLRSRGHEVMQASPSRGVKAVTGEGLQPALAGTDIVDVGRSDSCRPRLSRFRRALCGGVGLS